MGHETENTTVNWNNLKTADITDEPNYQFIKLSTEVKQLMEKLTDTEMSNNLNINSSKLISLMNNPKLNSVDEDEESLYSATSPFINSQQYNK